MLTAMKAADMIGAPKEEIIDRTCHSAKGYAAVTIVALTANAMNGEKRFWQAAVPF
jgi:hypothetical protein